MVRSMSVSCRQVFVSGRVQGVGFRYYTQEQARELGVTGWVRNLEDGRVEVWIEGDEARVAKMVAWLEHGPSHARVTNTVVHEREAREHTTFEVERTVRA